MYIAGIGGANVDIHSRGRGGAFRLRDSNLGEIHLTPGGVVRNMLEVISLLGVHTELLSAVSEDAFGQMLLKNIKQRSIGTRALKVYGPEKATATYLSVLDESGDMIAAICDNRIYDHLDAAYVMDNLDIINGAELLLLDANVSLSGLGALRDACERPIYMDPVATDLGERIRPFLGMCHTVKPNLQELEMLTSMRIKDNETLEEACCLMIDAGVEHVWVSMGERGLYFAAANGERLRGRCHDFDICVNATGAGDATMATIAWCDAQGFEPERTMEYALAAGMLATSSDATVNPNTSVGTLDTIIKEYVR